jgi:single-stranded DNA-binding protein
MISITVSGVLVAKPHVQLVGERGSRRCEFTVFDMRRVRVAGNWQPVWERVVFVTWDDEAERVALIMSKGCHVTCTGLQETQQWFDEHGERRLSITYRLTAWKINYRQRWANPARSSGPQGGTRAPQKASQPDKEIGPPAQETQDSPSNAANVLPVDALDRGEEGTTTA